MVVDKEPTFYEEDGNELIDTITYMLEHKNVPRMDIGLHDKRVNAKVYWTGMVLRIDIEGLRK